MPCDTQMRTRLDRIPASALRPVFRRLFRELQRGKMLKPYAVYGHHYLLSLDGTGFFASGAVHCKYCCERRHRNGTVTYHHQMLAGAIVHPDCRTVIPLAPEPIVRQDGQAKNDCERNASKRFLEALRREHPHVQVIVLEDGLASNGPHLDLLERPELAVPDQCTGARSCGAVPASGGPFGGLACGPERRGTRRGPPATGGSRRPAQCVPVRPSGDGVAVPGTHPEAGPETRTPMDLDHGSAGDPSRGTGDRTDGAQLLEDRKRDLQHAEELGVRFGTQLRVTVAGTLRIRWRL